MAGSHRPVSVVTGGADHDRTTKASTCFFIVLLMLQRMSWPPGFSLAAGLFLHDEIERTASRSEMGSPSGESIFDGGERTHARRVS